MASKESGGIKIYLHLYIKLGVVQEEKKSFADKLAIFSSGSKPSNTLQKRNTIS